MQSYMLILRKHNIREIFFKLGWALARHAADTVEMIDLG